MKCWICCVFIGMSHGNIICCIALAWIAMAFDCTALLGTSSSVLSSCLWQLPHSPKDGNNSEESKCEYILNNLNICVFKAFTRPERYRPASGLLTMYTATGNTSVDDGPRDPDVETATPKWIQGRKSTLVEDIDQSEWGQVVVEWTLMKIVHMWGNL